jgi:hypothetical protein
MVCAPPIKSGALPNRTALTCIPGPQRSIGVGTESHCQSQRSIVSRTADGHHSLMIGWSTHEAAAGQERAGHIWPNKSLQPTATAVMPPACAGVTPSVAVAEH